MQAWADVQAAGRTVALCESVACTMHCFVSRSLLHTHVMYCSGSATQGHSHLVHLSRLRQTACVCHVRTTSTRTQHQRTRVCRTRRHAQHLHTKRLVMVNDCTNERWYGVADVLCLNSTHGQQRSRMHAVHGVHEHAVPVCGTYEYFRYALACCAC